jgi:hypothetical protein
MRCALSSSHTGRIGNLDPHHIAAMLGSWHCKRIHPILIGENHRLQTVAAQDRSGLPDCPIILSIAWALLVSGERS